MSSLHRVREKPSLKRAFYQRERLRGRRHRSALGTCAPVGCADATSFEIHAALAVLAKQSGFNPGRGLGYEPISDRYTIIGQKPEEAVTFSMFDATKATTTRGKAMDLIVEGTAVADLIKLFRRINGGAADGRQLRPKDLPGVDISPFLGRQLHQRGVKVAH